MMTPAQLKSYDFKTTGRNAYKADDVDQFLAEVAINYEKMYRENSELIKRINLMADKLESYKNDEVDIKQAVISAQKAADIIIKDAEDNIAQKNTEAESIISEANAKAEAIKIEAEKQAIADSDLLLSIATDKAEEIIAKAKEKAHGILIAANDSASNTMGQANRTITSESLHYDMLKKEVSEFRASILAQYKAHIELISKLPELAVEEASKIENVDLPQTSVEELEAEIETKEAQMYSVPEEDTVLEFVPDEAVEEDDSVADISELVAQEEEELASEPVVKTTLPYDFFEGDSTIEFVDNSTEEQEEPICEIDAFENSVGMEFDEEEPSTDDTSTKGFSVSSLDDIDFSLFEDDSNDEAKAPAHSVINDDDADDDDDAYAFFNSIQSIDDDEEDDDEDDDDEPKKLSFFRKRK